MKLEGWERPRNRRATRKGVRAIMARILVIDDDREMRAMLKVSLMLEGHEVVMAANGKEGFAHYQGQAADLVITDLYMPDQECLETIRQFRKSFPEARIIAMSGGTAAETMLSISKKLGAVESLQKPFEQHEFFAVVNRVLTSAL